MFDFKEAQSETQCSVEGSNTSVAQKTRWVDRPSSTRFTPKKNMVKIEWHEQKLFLYRHISQKPLNPTCDTK